MIALTLLATPRSARAEEKPLSPYIDQIRQELKPAEQGSYIDAERKKLEAKDAAAGKSSAPPPSYTEELRKQLDAGAPQPSYTEQERAKLAPKEEGGAIQAVHEGRSELHGKRVGSIHHAAGLRVGGVIKPRDISTSVELGSADFATIYKESSHPEFALFYEYQPWHSEWFGSLGLVASLGMAYFKGEGVFAVPNLTRPTGEAIGSTSHVTTQLFALPLTIGLNYRFNLLRILRPYVMVGPSLIGFYEIRSDDQNSHYASARGINFTAGTAILLDWLSKDASWQLYAQNGIHHAYLTVEFTQISSFKGPVVYSTSGVFGGLAFEF
jgi:hypothetical protein